MGPHAGTPPPDRSGVLGVWRRVTPIKSIVDPVTPFRILVVCIGNVCRSPLGERLLRARLPHPEFEVSSAGVQALAGRPMDIEAATQLVLHGGEANGFVARQLTPAMLEESDLVLTATKALRSRVLEDSPRALRRSFTAIEFASLLDLVEGEDPTALVAAAALQRSRVPAGDLDVPDPYRRGEQSHIDAAQAMAVAVERIAKGLTR